MFGAAHCRPDRRARTRRCPTPIVTFTPQDLLGPAAGASSTARHAAAMTRRFPGWQGGPLEHVIAARPCFGPYSRVQEYAQQWYTARTATPCQGFRLVSGGTDNHMMVVDLRPFDSELRQRRRLCSTSPASPEQEHDSRRPHGPFVTSGVRIGAHVTTQGMREPWGRSNWLPALRQRTDPLITGARAEVATQCGQFPLTLIATLRSVSKAARIEASFGSLTRNQLCATAGIAAMLAAGAWFAIVAGTSRMQAYLIPVVGAAPWRQPRHTVPAGSRDLVDLITSSW